MTTDDRYSHSQRSLAGVVLAALLLALWGGAAPGSPPSGSTDPAIDAVTPASGPEGTVVTISGENFGLSVGALQGTSGVSFNGVWSTARSWSDTGIQVAVPPGAATGPVVVTVSGEASSGVEFEVTGPGGSGPSIGAVSPMLGLEGTMVTIRGANFGSTAEMGGVSFNGVWAAASSWTEEEIRVPVPADAGTGPVVVTANGLASEGVVFMVPDSGLGEPAIDSLSAASGPEGTVVTIEGKNFGPSIGASKGTSGVSFNGVWGEPTSWSETRIQVAVPTGAPSGLVTVAVGGEASNGLAFVVQRPAPVIEAVDATFGPEGTTVEITGRNFGPAMEARQGWSGVSFEGTWGVPASWSDGKIRVAAPEGVSSGLIVVSSVGQSSNGIPFSVAGAKRMSPEPAVLASSVAPRAGPELKSLNPTEGEVGDSVRIKGKNFGSQRGSNKVTFNGTEVTNYVVWENKKIDVTVPVGATTGDVVVTIGGVATDGIEFTVTAGTDPTISSLDPDSGPEGTSVTITGANFGATRGTSTVAFNGTAATPTSWSDTEIAAAVPMGATTGNVVVTVDGTASAGAAFTVTPAIGSLDPTSGAEGTSVEITGTSFGATRGTSTVTFNGTAATPASWSDTSITVTVPSGATTGNLVVTVGGEASNGVSFTVTPAIGSLSPDRGPVGASVEISGTSFGATQGTSTVTFNGTAAMPASWSDTSITVTVPSGATTGNVVVTVGGEASNGVSFTVTPAISSLSPDRGPVGASVEISGTSFGATRGTSTVAFNGTAATATEWSATSITVTVPSGATTGNVVVTAGGEASDGVAFTVTPGIGSLSPIAGPEGATVEISGTDFGATQGTSTVTFNGTAATPTSWSDTSITVTVPARATSGNVVVTVGGVASNGSAFAVGTDPVISSVSPASGSSGTTVTVSGANFGATQGTGKVTFNGKAVTAYTSWSDTSIRVGVPSGATTGKVVVTVDSVASNGVTYTVKPEISGLNPISGLEGATVVVSGRSFGATQGTSTVAFNGTPATVTNWGDSSITVTVPAGAVSGKVVVTVDGQASNGVTFTVGTDPVISALNPSSGSVGTTVMVSGANFGSTQGTSTVTFNGTSATPTSWSDSSITATVPAAATSGKVVVTVDGTASTGVAFAVTPAISSLSRVAGPVGASVTIKGTSFGSARGASTVTFNGTAATPGSWSDTSITVPVPVGATSGSVVVTVGGVASNGAAFTVGTDPVVSSLSPVLGQVETTVVIGGANFGDSQGTSTVTFNGTAAAPGSWSDTSITVAVPSTATTGPVVVTVGGVASNQVTFTVTGPPPVISKLKPDEGDVGDSVKVKGEHFGTVQGDRRHYLQRTGRRREELGG